MAIGKGKPCCVLLAVVLIHLILIPSGHSQNFPFPDSLPSFENIDDGNKEWVALPSLASTSPSHEALVPVRLTNTSLKSYEAPVLAEIYFDTKRHLLRHEAAQVIEESATLLHEKNTRKVHIEAYCDRRETTAYSHALGIRRINEVVHYLENLGVPSSQLSVASFGPHLPRCRTSSTACWQDTLRIEHTFQLLAMRHPQSGCVTRLRLDLEFTDQSFRELTTRHLFLQRIHLAESR